MTRCVVVTTIMPPSQDVLDHCRRGLHDGTEIVVVADRKTPVREYESLTSEFSNLHVLSIDRQHDLFPQLSAAIPFNHYARKNLGYAFAITRGFPAIFDTDDDNRTTTEWQQVEPGVTRLRVRQRDTSSGLAFYNVYGLYTKTHLWPRGYPLECVRDSGNNCEVVEDDAPDGDVALWQGLVDGDPDVDAIARLTSPAAACDVRFDPSPRRVVLESGVLCPLNSQNVWWVSPSVFALMYLPATANFRVCDILRGYVAQQCLWQRGARAGFTQPTALQVRNVHDLLADFASELPLYLHASRMNLILRETSRHFTGTAEDLLLAYHALAVKEFVQPREVQILEAWLALVG